MVGRFSEKEGDGVGRRLKEIRGISSDAVL
jgi:hypothetical protein